MLSIGGQIKRFSWNAQHIFSWVTNRRECLDHLQLSAMLHALSVTLVISVHVSVWSTARVRACVCVWGLQECWVGTGEARQADGTSSLCTAQLILLRIKDSRKEKSDGRSPPRSITLSLARPPLSLFPCLEKRKKNLKQKAWFICKCAAAHTGPPWCTGRGGAESARMRGNKGIVESFDSVFVALRPSGTCQAGRTLESISLVWNGAAITNCAMYRWVFTHVCFCMCERSACGLHVVWVCVFSTEGVKRQRDTPLSRRPSLSLLCWNWARCTSLDHSKAIKWPLSATGSGSL